MKNRKKVLFILLIISFLISTNFVFAQGDVIKFRPQIGIPESEIQPGEEITVTGDTFAKYIISLYNWAIRVIILLAIIMIMIAGFQWMTAAGNAPKVTQAKERIASALIGVLLAVASYTILSFINPSLVSFRSLSLEPIIEKNIEGRCIEDQICVYKDSNKLDCKCKTRVNLWYTVGLTPREGNIKVESGKKCGTVDTVGGTGESRFMCIRMGSIYNDCSKDETCLIQEKVYTEQNLFACPSNKFYQGAECSFLIDCSKLTTSFTCMTGGGKSRTICLWKNEKCVDFADL